MKPLLEARDVGKLLPHRYPLLLVDRILEIEEGKRIVGLKNFTSDEPFFQGHFPGNPIVPGTILVEAMAQVGALFVLGRNPRGRGGVLYLTGLDGVRFRRPVQPGDQVLFELELVGRKRDMWKVRGTARVGDAIVMEATLLAVYQERPETEDEA